MDKRWRNCMKNVNSVYHYVDGLKAYVIALTDVVGKDSITGEDWSERKDRVRLARVFVLALLSLGGDTLICALEHFAKLPNSSSTAAPGSEEGYSIDVIRKVYSEISYIAEKIFPASIRSAPEDLLQSGFFSLITETKNSWTIAASRIRFWRGISRKRNLGSSTRPKGSRKWTSKPCTSKRMHNGT